MLSWSLDHSKGSLLTFVASEDFCSLLQSLTKWQEKVAFQPRQKAPMNPSQAMLCSQISLSGGIFFFFFFFFGHAYSMRKFPGQGGNPYHCSNPSCSSDNTRPTEPPRGLLEASFFSFFLFLGPHPWPMEIPRLRVELEL